MQNFARLLILFCVLAASSPGETNVIRLRIATFNIAMGLPEPGMLGEKLTHGQDSRLQQVAEILQRVRPDIIVLNEFDFDLRYDAAGLFNEQYLSRGWNGQQAIYYPYSYRNEVNTGLDSGLDLDGNGKTGDPQDAWGYGSFPGQYGMLVLSRFPIRQEAVRTFQYFPWASLPAANRPLIIILTLFGSSCASAPKATGICQSTSMGVFCTSWYTTRLHRCLTDRKTATANEISMKTASGSNIWAPATRISSLTTRANPVG
jgi:hypothetical protein